MSLALDVGGVVDNNAEKTTPRRLGHSPISGISQSRFGGRVSAMPSPGGGEFSKNSRDMWQKPTGREAVKMYEDLERTDDKAYVDNGLKFNVVVKQDDDEERFETELLEVYGKPYDEDKVDTLPLKNTRLL